MPPTEHRYPYRKDVHQRLIAAANAGQTITYSELGAGRRWIGAYLFRICHEEDAAGRPPLTCIVVRARTGLPGAGMYQAMKEVGYVLPGESEIEVWERAVAEVVAYWRDNPAEDLFATWEPRLSDYRSMWPRFR